MARSFAIVLLAVAFGVAGCAPKAPPLTGIEAPARLPRTQLPPGHRTVAFDWRLSEPNVDMRGEGVARIASPDSVRLDFFVAGGMGAGYAILIGDELRAPGAGFFARFLPEAPLLWATLGHLRLPPTASDTVVRVDGDTLRADIGRDPRWRLAFVDDALRRLERIEGNRIQEIVARPPRGAVRYERPSSRRVLEITVTDSAAVPAFDASIWK